MGAAAVGAVHDARVEVWGKEEAEAEGAEAESAAEVAAGVEGATVVALVGTGVSACVCVKCTACNSLHFAKAVATNYVGIWAQAGTIARRSFLFSHWYSR